MIGKLKLRILLFCWGKMRKRFLMLRIELSACDKEGYGAEKGS